MYWQNHFHLFKFKTDIKIWQWFYYTDCSSCSADNLEIYNFIHQDYSFEIHLQSIWNWLKINSSNWKRDDFIVISNMFEWLFDFNSESLHLSIIMSDEFSMYHWHLHKIDEHKNYDWLWNMFYNLIEQMV